MGGVDGAAASAAAYGYVLWGPGGGCRGMGDVGWWRHGRGDVVAEYEMTSCCPWYKISAAWPKLIWALIRDSGKRILVVKGYRFGGDDIQDQPTGFVSASGCDNYRREYR